MAAVPLLSEGGVDAVSVEAVARRLGVTKGGFYGHFRDRDDYLRALVAYWEELGTEVIIATVDGVEGDAAARSEALWTLATDTGMGPDLAIRDWARRDPEVRAVVQRVDNRRMAYLRALFADLGFEGAACEARSMLVYSLLIGDHFIAATHGRYGRKRVLAECRALLRGAG